MFLWDPNAPPLKKIEEKKALIHGQLVPLESVASHWLEGWSPCSQSRHPASGSGTPLALPEQHWHFWVSPTPQLVLSGRAPALSPAPPAQERWLTGGAPVLSKDACVPLCILYA